MGPRIGNGTDDWLSKLKVVRDDRGAARVGHLSPSRGESEEATGRTEDITRRADEDDGVSGPRRACNDTRRAAPVLVMADGVTNCPECEAPEKDSGRSNSDGAATSPRVDRRPVEPRERLDDQQRDSCRT